LVGFLSVKEIVKKMKMLEVKTMQRFLSVDALRGLTVAAMLLVNSAGDWDHVYPCLEHASWHGATRALIASTWRVLWCGVVYGLSL